MADGGVYADIKDGLAIQAGVSRKTRTTLDLITTLHCHTSQSTTLLWNIDILHASFPNTLLPIYSSPERLSNLQISTIHHSILLPESMNNLIGCSLMLPEDEGRIRHE